MIFSLLRLVARYVGWLWPILGFAQTPHFSELLTHSNWQAQDNIVFVLKGTEAASISELRLHFLTGEDCYSGYQQGYRSAAEITPFLIKKDQPFELSGAGIYQAAQSVLNAEELSQVKAVLLRFADRDHGQRYQQFARFTGSCQDQGINCCIPITCAPNAGVCAAKHDMSIQTIIWDSVSSNPALL